MDFINALSKSRIHIFLLRRSGALLFDIYVPLFCLIVGVNSLSQFYATILQLAHPTICRHQKLIHCSPFCNPMQVRREMCFVQLSKNFGANYKKDSFLKLPQQLNTHSVGHWLQLFLPSLMYHNFFWTYPIKGKTRPIFPFFRKNSETCEPTHP